MQDVTLTCDRTVNLLPLSVQMTRQHLHNFILLLKKAQAISAFVNNYLHRARMFQVRVNLDIVTRITFTCGSSQAAIN